MWVNNEEGLLEQCQRTHGICHAGILILLVSHFSGMLAGTRQGMRECAEKLDISDELVKNAASTESGMAFLKMNNILPVTEVIPPIFVVFGEVGL